MKVFALFLLGAQVALHAEDSPKAADKEPLPLIKPAASLETGLLLQPPLDLSKFTTEEFIAISSTVGPDKIHKKWTSAVTPLPPHADTNVHGLSEEDVKAYMQEARRLFDEGASVPISDICRLSTACLPRKLLN